MNTDTVSSNGNQENHHGDPIPEQPAPNSTNASNQGTYVWLPANDNEGPKSNIYMEMSHTMDLRLVQHDKRSLLQLRPIGLLVRKIGVASVDYPQNNFMHLQQE